MAPADSNTTKGIFGGVAILSVLTMAWSQIKLVAHRIVSLGVVTATFQNDARTMVSFFVMRKMRRSKFGDFTFSTTRKYVRPVRRFIEVMFETIGKDPIVAYYGRVPMLVSRKSDDNDNISVVFLRGTIILEDFVKEVENFFNHYCEGGISAKRRRFMVRRKYGRLGHMFDLSSDTDKKKESLSALKACPEGETWLMGRIVGWEDNDLGEGLFNVNKAMETLAYPESIESIFADICKWKQSEDWYKQRNIPWKIGLLLHGNPGTGKSAFVRATGMDLDMPIYILDIATMTNEEFVMAWESALAQAPVIVLIEDFDAVFRGRERLQMVAGGLTFDCLLSRISGVENSDGVVLFITTNDLQAVDPAIGQLDIDTTTRPGRIDIVAEFQNMAEGERRRLAHIVMNEMDSVAIETAVVDGEGETGAQFQARCTKLALDFYWKVKESK